MCFNIWDVYSIFAEKGSKPKKDLFPIYKITIKWSHKEATS